MEQLLKILIPILIQIESGGDPNAIGDNGDAVGVLQIHKITVDDVNRILGINRFTYLGRGSISESKSMCRFYLKHYAPKFNGDYTELEKLCHLGRMWNGGPKGASKASTMPYRAKIIALYNKLEH